MEFKSSTLTVKGRCDVFGQATVYTKNLEEESHGLESSQDRVVKESIACRSEPADSDAKTGIGFLQMAPADNDKGYVRRQDETC